MDVSDHAPFVCLLLQLDPQATLVGVTPLTGGVSAAVMALDVLWGDGREGRVVVRQHGEGDRTRNPQVALDEFRLLQTAHAAGIPVAEPLLLHETGACVPLPVIVSACVDGVTEFDPVHLDSFLDQAVTQLVNIHLLPIIESSFLSKIDREVGAPFPCLDEVMGEGQIRAALTAVHPMQRNESVVLHGDFWPGNLLWRDGILVGVLDWEDACLGDPLVDLGNTRLELLWAFGTAAMIGFTERYYAAYPLDLTDLPYWDLRAALRPCGKLTTWGLVPETEHRMIERHAAFVQSAITAIQ